MCLQVFALQFSWPVRSISCNVSLLFDHLQNIKIVWNQDFWLNCKTKATPSMFKYKTHSSFSEQFTYS